MFHKNFTQLLWTWRAESRAQFCGSHFGLVVALFGALWLSRRSLPNRLISKETVRITYARALSFVAQ